MRKESFSDQEEEELSNDNNEENKEQMEVEDDSFENKNKDLLDQKASDDEDEEENIHAWGSQKDKFYQSEEESDSDIEDDEEKEALEIQKKNAVILEDNDFFDEDLHKQNFDEDIKYRKNDEKIDLNKLSEDEKLNLIVESSPELLSLLKDYKKLILEFKNKIEPLKQIIYSNEFEISPKLKKFIRLKSDIIGSYCVYILYYLSLKKSKNFSKNHPVFNKMINAKSMINKLKPLEEKFSQEISKLLEQFKERKISNIKKNLKESGSITKERTLKPILNNSKKNNENIKKNNENKKKKIESENLKKIFKEIEDSEEEKRIGTKSKKCLKEKSQLYPPNEIQENFDLLSDDLDLDLDSSDFEDDFYKSVKRKKTDKKKLKKKTKEIQKEQFFNEIKLSKVDENEGRKITYEMLKNKGLTRKRKKIDRNSRVKLRMKFGKSMNKLKSKGIFLRKKEDVYRGELTGINAGLIKGVSLKSTNN